VTSSNRGRDELRVLVVRRADRGTRGRAVEFTAATRGGPSHLCRFESEGSERLDAQTKTSRVYKAFGGLGILSLAGARGGWSRASVTGLADGWGGTAAGSDVLIQGLPQERQGGVRPQSAVGMFTAKGPVAKPGCAGGVEDHDASKGLDRSPQLAIPAGDSSTRGAGSTVLEKDSHSLVTPAHALARQGFHPAAKRPTARR